MALYNSAQHLVLMNKNHLVSVQKLDILFEFSDPPQAD